MGEDTARDAQALVGLSTSINMVNTEKESSPRAILRDTTSTMGEDTARYAQALGELSSSDIPPQEKAPTPRYSASPKRSPRPSPRPSPLADMFIPSVMERNSPNLSLFTPSTETQSGGMSDYEKIAKLFQ